MAVAVEPRMRSGSGVARRLAAETLGTALLLATIVGSGIMGDRLSPGSAAIALLANSLATGAGLVALILALGPVSGAHFNPVVTLAMALRGRHSWKDAPAYVLAQGLGAIAGVAAAHLMFGEPIFSSSRRAREGGAQFFSEGVATFGLLVVILGCSSRHPKASAFAVGSYIAAAYWFTASTSFANPAVTLARSFTDTFSGIRWVDAPGFVGAQIAGAAAATLLCGWLFGESREEAP